MTIRWWLAALVAVPVVALGVALAWPDGHGADRVVARLRAPSTAATESTAPAEPRRTSDAFAFGTYDKLYAADSPWNSRPVDPVLAAEGVPKSKYFPTVAAGAWSTGVFLAKATDPAVVVHGMPGTAGVWDPDVEQARDVEIPHWPDAVEPAVESDGHAEIVDPVLGVVHSFWQLKKRGGRWTAALYAWSRVDGRGWGDPAHYYQGARAAAVPSSGGLIRSREVDDGDTLYRHALAMSLTFNALAADPTYVFPATAADNDAAKTNSGRIPEGALLMLPPSFDVAKIGTPSLRKIAETLKVYGAYVVDRNEGTPFSIYVEIGSGYELHRHGWSNPAADDLETIRAALRPVASTGGWLDGNGRATTRDTNLNLLSMRGPWRVASGPAGGAFASWKQAVVFPAGGSERTELVNDGSRGLQPILWARPVPGTSYRLRAIATGGAKLRIRFRAKTDQRVLYESPELSDGESATFAWPADAAIVVHAIGGTDGASSVRGELVAAR